MRLVVISDLHDSVAHVAGLRDACIGADALIVCGDFTTFGDHPRVQKVPCAAGVYRRRAAGLLSHGAHPRSRVAFLAWPNPCAESGPFFARQGCNPRSVRRAAREISGPRMGLVTSIAFLIVLISAMAGLGIPVVNALKKSPRRLFCLCPHEPMR